MSIEIVQVQTPSNLIVFNDTSIGSGIDVIKTGSVKLYWAKADNTLNTTTSYIKLYGTTAHGSIVVGSTLPDIILPVPAGQTQYVTFLLDAASPGTTFNQISAVCVTQGGFQGTTPPASPVNFTLAYV